MKEEAMKVHVRCTGVEHSQSLVVHATRKIHQHLSRFGHRLSGVDARLSDVNGPHGGRDKRCLVIANGPGLGVLCTEELHEDFYASVDRALDRLAQTIGRSIERARERQAATKRRVSVAPSPRQRKLAVGQW
jgi:putative sigma-54 modulation protein